MGARRPRRLNADIGSDGKQQVSGGGAGTTQSAYSPPARPTWSGELFARYTRFYVAINTREGGGPLVLYQPALGGPDELVARALKAAFFEAVLHDPDRARGCEDLPLVGYVADEFHRFVTSDRVHGEQSFLDTCRSFGAFCVLACQSVAGIEHALAEGAGSNTRNEAAVSMLMTNTATKLVFRSTDPKTLQPLHEWCPHHPGLDAVTRVRPPTTLAPGECYALLPDGRFERRRLEPFETGAGRAQGRQASAARS